MDEQSIKLPTQEPVADATALSMKEVSAANLAEFQAIAVAWAFSSSVISLQGDQVNIAPAMKRIKLSLAQSHNIAQIDPLNQLDEATLTEFLATEWCLARGGLGDGVAAVIECIEKRESSPARYLLLVESADALADEVWQLLYTLCKRGDGRIGLLLGGEPPRLNEQCDKFFSSAGLSVLHHTLDYRVVMDEKQPLDSSHPPQKKTASLLRNAYLIIVVILVLALLFFQQKINSWVASSDPTTAAVEILSDLPQAMSLNKAGIEVHHEVESKLHQPTREEPHQVASSELTAQRESHTTKVTKPEAHVEESLKALAAVTKIAAVAAETPTPEDRVVANKGSKLKTESWILSQPPQQYTLHVMSVRNEQSLRDFIIEKNLTDKAAYYRALRKSGEWFVLLVGHYVDIEAAEKVVPAIEQQLNVKGIIIRKFEYSQADIVASRG
ncbi:MAG: hypothetical protein L3J94_01665 [Gammaproteobacteria bacterium]|nr:hypothetical protein [Gammaproteobacteria bacterium]